ncbi:MAG TPA: hypothetical protein VL443_13525 [Cyclobacteriaceae bacterium]|jgi:hypothetical protein|nr:hypothetical protein [Cyclobacteriaceae bacterium]
MRHFLSLLIILSFTLLSLSNCSDTSQARVDVKDTTTIKKDTFFISNFSVTDLPQSTAFDIGTGIGHEQYLSEISGICMSYAYDSAVWVEEDSGNENKIYLLKFDGSLMGSIRMPVDNRDWEDMSIAPGPIDGVHYIYLAEIGDNSKSYSTKYIYRFAEPSTNVPVFDKDLNSTVDIITFQYPDGNKNAEAVMIDPSTKDIYVISKEDQATIYVARYPQSVNTKITLTIVGKLPISTVTAADISPDGNEILIKNYQQVFYWKKKDNESISQLLKQKPVRLAYSPEPKGESICWATDGSGYFTTSEIVDNAPAEIFFFKRK